MYNLLFVCEARVRACWFEDGRRPINLDSCFYVYIYIYIYTHKYIGCMCFSWCMLVV